MRTIAFGVKFKNQAIACMHDCILAEFLPKFEDELRTLTLATKQTGIRRNYVGIKYRKYEFELRSLRKEWDNVPTGRIAVLPELSEENQNIVARMDELLNLSQIVTMYLGKLMRVANVPKDIPRLSLITNSTVEAVQFNDLAEGSIWQLEPIPDSRVMTFKSDTSVIALVNKINEELLIQRMMWS